MSRIHDALKKLETTELLEEEPARSRVVDSRCLVDVSTTPSQLADVPEMPWKGAGDALLSFDSEESKAAGEEFRGLRVRLQQLREKQSLRSLLITSAVAQEGRSFVAANLARVLSLQAGCRVLLIDGDLRGRQLCSMFGTCASPGLAEYLLGEVEERDVLQRGKADNLFLISCGRAIAGPTELIANGRFRHLLSRMNPLFDWIIVDSPPATTVSDACLLSNFCDGVLIVVRARTTPFGIVRKALERFSEPALAGIVLNEIQTNRSNVSRQPNIAG